MFSTSRQRPAAELLLIGNGPYGADGPKAFTDALGVPVRASLPCDPAAAAVLSDGARPDRGFGSSPLIRAAAALAERLVSETAAEPSVDSAAGARR